MGSKSTRDGDSPSASSFFLPISQLPQLRHSRRGSLASLSSVSQLDKETLSQALDQIHSTASQTETLTTFNEYTSPPSSSSGPDTKGIASELQGGLSGLYSRFRASVGNAKDIINNGVEDGTGDTTSLNSAKAATQSSTSGRNVESAPVLSASMIPQVESTPGSGRESLLGEVGAGIDAAASDKGHNLKPSKISSGSASISSKSVTGSLAALKSPPVTLTQITYPTSPALAEVNASAIRRSDFSAELRPDEKGTASNGPQKLGRILRTRERLDGHIAKEDIFSPKVSRVEEPGCSSSKQPAPVVISDRDTVGLERLGKPSIGMKSRGDPSSQSSVDSIQPFLGLASDVTNKSLMRRPSSDTDGDTTKLPNIITSNSTGHDEVFNGSGKTVRSGKNDETPSKQGFYQHLELPARKSMAPPIVSRSRQINAALSRASSSETNTDSVVTAPPQTWSDRQYSRSDDRAQSKDATSKPLAAAPTHRDSKTMNVFSQVKNKVLNKEYWMKDENARDCFYCGDPFSTFRRKHHCSKPQHRWTCQQGKTAPLLTRYLGTCGQIFDAKCTSLLSGEHFGQSGTLRVCKPCEGIINGEDDSSEFSDEGSLSVHGLRPRHGSTGASDVLASPTPSFSSTGVKGLPRNLKTADLAVPTMSIPATRKARGESSRKPTVLEIDAERTLMRPSSSRSLKSSFANKPFQSGHRRHNSRHQFQRSFKPVNEDSAPFHQNPADDKARFGQLPAFHDDNIIDPDLAPYLSDEGSSGDEQMSIMTALNGDGLSRSHDNERHGLSNLLASSRKARSRAGDKSVSGVTFASRDADNHSLTSSRTANPPRSSKRRNLSVTGNVHMRPSPRSYRASAAVPNFGLSLHESLSSSALAQAASSANSAGGSRMIRSSSMRGAAAPAVELNNASLRHVRKLLHQLLQDSNVPGITSWEKALVPILLRATDDVNPDVQNGDDIDIRHYVKLKKIPGGRPGDTSYVSGLVFTKNLALKSMPRGISHPNILILTFPLEYARHQQHFMSLEPVIRQEREFLQNLVNRIAALRPQLLLVERNVSGLALEFLEQANIATAYNVKASVLEAVSRCCQTRIISSIDKLAIKPAQAGKCASFYLKTYVNERRKKTYMFLSGCAKELGCTIVLRGDDDITLAKMKHITEFMIYVVYNLKLETCLMRDEFALIPSTTEIGSPSLGTDHARNSLRGMFADVKESTGAATHAGSDLQKAEGTAIQNSTDKPIAEAVESKKSDSLGSKQPKPRLHEEDSLPEDVPMPTYYGDLVEEHKTKIVSASPFVKFVQPYILMRVREQERRLAYIKRLRDQDVLEEQNVSEKVKPEKFDLIRPEMVHERVQTASRKVREVLHAVHDAEYDKALHNYQTQSKQWEAYISGNTNLLDPYAHQNIAVLYSVVCTVTTVPCSGPDMLALGFYNEHETDADFEADCTLGQYVEDLCLGANTVCTANGCERKMFEHHRQYVHGEAQLSVFVERHPCKLRGLQDTILMWSSCRICGKETQVLPMSESTWKYSFGKYLELSFWSSGLRARADVCPHDLHRNHLRYFGFKDMALRVHYDPITLLEIIVPRARITWKVDNDLRFKNELFSKMEDRVNKFMFSVKARIRSINTESILPDKAESCKQEVEKLTKKASDEHHALIQRLRRNYMNSKHYEVIPLNRVIRETQEKVPEWDNAFADFDRNFFPSEKDIRRLATLQLKKIFLERDESTASLTSTDDGATTPIAEEGLTEKTSLDDIPALTPMTRQMSPEKAHDMLASVVEKHVSNESQLDQRQSALATAIPTIESETEPKPTAGSLQDVEREDIRHLDLAVSSDLVEKLPSGQRITTADTQLPIREEGARMTGGPAKESGSFPKPSKADLTPGDQNLRKAEPSSPIAKVSEISQVSGIPRPTESSRRSTRSNVSPTLSRAQSQPAQFRSEKLGSGSIPPMSVLLPSLSPSNPSPELGETPRTSIASTSKPTEKKLSDRLGLGALKPSGVTGHSMIPRSIVSRKKETKVSNLAKHFEQLSREFEKERIKERRQRAAKSRQARAYPMAASKPIVQVYRNVHEAVEEREPSDEDLLSDPTHQDHDESPNTSRAMANTRASQTHGEGFHAEETTAETTEAEDSICADSHVGSDIEGEGVRSDDDHFILDDIQIPGTADQHHALSPDEAQLDIKLDLPKHEKNSLMKMLTNFWAERSASGWQPLEYPLNVTDHIFADSDILVREDEPSSLIAFALSSEVYQAKLRSIMETASVSDDQDEKSEKPKPSTPALSTEEAEVERDLLRPTGTHLKYQFVEGNAKMLCKVFYAEQFDAVRRKCGVSERIEESLSRCMKWDSKGGKTKSVFLKTLDDRFVLKSLSPVETTAFLRFAPAYFRIMSESLFHELPSVIAKMLGFYQVVIKNPITGVDFNWFMIVMENLFYDRSPTRIFDLKGSMRNRRIQSTGEQNEVLLDENMVEFIYESPLFSREHSKKLLRASVWNDTLFLSRQNVMDYSLMIAIDENRKELVVGIIDCIRTFTWDKKLESWIKDRGKNRPTVTSPKEYKSRFREAMGRYVLQAPR